MEIIKDEKLKKNKIKSHHKIGLINTKKFDV